MSLTDCIYNAEIGKIKIDFPSSCNSNCIGCYCHASKKDPGKRIPIETIEKVLADARKLGIKQLVLAADGEPLIDQDYFFKVIRYATQMGIESIIYTIGSLIAPEISSRLYNLKTSLLVKRNSMIHQKQNQMLRVDLSEKMLQGIHNLINAGFNQERLALESFVSKANERDLADVLRFCRKNNLIPYFEDFVCINQPQEVIDQMALTPEQLTEAFQRYQQIDKNEFGIGTQVTPGSRRYGIKGCSFEGLISIDTGGNIKQCIFDIPYGNIYEDNLKEIYPKIPKDCNGCSATVMRN